MKHNYFLKFLLFLFLGLISNLSFGHSVQTFWELRDDGTIRFWLEHWHSDVSDSNLSTFYIIVDQGNGNENVAANGYYNNTSFASLPVQGDVNNRAQCGSANTYNDWVYYDFYPAKCNEAITITFVDGPPAATAPDCSGLFGYSITQTFDDRSAPVINAMDLNVGTNNGCDYLANSFSNVTVVDNCDSTPTVVYSVAGNPIDPATYLFPLGATTVTVEATDSTGSPSNNSTTETFDVIVKDEQKPEFTSFPADIEVDADPDLCGRSVTYSSPLAEDNCSSNPMISLVNGLPSDSIFPVGSTTVTFQASDESGNTSTANLIVKVVDKTAPVVQTQNISIQLDENGTANITPEMINNESSDACGIADLSLDRTEFGCENVGDNMVTLTVEDKNGNTSEATATVTVEDNVKPVAIAQDITVYLDENGQAVIAASDVNDGSTDNCTAAEDLTFSLDNTLFGCENTGDKGETINASALNFDGNDFVSIPDAPSLRLTGDMTIEAWFKADGFNADWVRIAGKGADGPRNYGLWYHPDGSFLFQQYGDGVEVGFHQTINTGEWYHIAGVKSGNVGKLYINGELVATNTGGTNPATSTDPLTIGYAGFHTYHIGQIDEVRLWDKARTDQEILNDHNRTLNPGTDGLLAYYNMEEAAGTDLIDLTGNGYDGSLQEFSQSTVWTQSTETLGPDNIVTLTVRDKSGNESTAKASVTVLDNLAPVVQTKNITVDLDESGNVLITPAMVIQSSTDNCAIESLELDTTEFTCANIGANTVTLTAKDVNGNVSTNTATVTVEDNIAAEVLTQDITIQLDENGQAFIEVSDIENGSSDNCGILNSTLDKSTFDCKDVRNSTNYSLNLAATNGYVISEDASGKISGANSITLEGWVYPRASGYYQYLMGLRNDTDADFYMLQMPDNSIEARFRNSAGIYYDINTGNLVLNEWQHLAFTYDGSDLKLYVNGELETKIPTSGTFKASDLEKFYLGAYDRGGDNFYFGGSLEDVRLWNVARTETEIKETLNKSILGTPESLAINYNFSDGSGDVLTDQSGNAYDGRFVNIDENTAWVEDSPTETANIVTLTVTDVNGNTSSATATVTVEDVDAPVLTPEADQDVVLDAECSITVPDLTDGSEATDNCTVTITQSPAAGTVVSSEHNGTVDVVVTATDAAGNTDESTVVLTAIDNEAPVLTAEADQEVILDAECSITVPNLIDGSSASDNCTTTITQSPAAGTVVSSEHNGTVDVVVTATDAAGNTDGSTVVLTAIDNQAPVLTAEADQDVVLDAECSITVPDLMDGSEATDNCTVTITQLPAAGTVVSSEHNATVGVVVTATDAAGNTDESTVVLTAIDNEAPVLTAEADQEVVLDAECSITVPNLIDGSSAADNCTVTITQSPAVGTLVSSAHNGTVDVVVTATDAAGNTDESTVVLTAIDNQAPVLTAEADQEVILDAECSITVPNLIDGSSASDNCTTTITQSPAAGTVVSSEHNGTVDVVVTATDAAGNTDGSTVVLTAIDNQAPVLTAEADQDVVLDAECSITVPDLMDGSEATDNCTVTITQLPAAGTVVSSEHNATVDVVVTAIDAAGNTDESTVVLTAIDNQVPVLTAEADQDVNLDEFCAITVPNVMGTATDNCTVSITQSPVAGTVISSEHNGIVTVLVTATDTAGNIDESTVVLTAKDNIAPTPVMETLAPVRAECIVEAADVVKPLAVDNCTESIEGVADLYFPVTRGGSTMITWKYDDGNGNVTFQQQEIIIEDTTAPIPDVAELQDIVVECGVSDIPAPTATDNCRGSITGTTSGALSYSDQGEYTITWSFDDENGNITTQQQNVIVRDVTAPEVLTRDITVYLDPETNVTIAPEDVDNGSSDNCSEINLSLDQTYFDEVGTYQVTLSATDAAGNTSQATATVTVEIDGIDSKEVHVVPTILKQSSVAKVVVPFRSKIMKVEILESETQRYKTFEGNGLHEMEIDIAPFKGTLLVRVIDEDGTVHLKKLIAF